MAEMQHGAHIVDVVDGDTVVVAHPSNTVEIMHLADIDAPELAEPHGQAARAALAAKTLGKPIRLIVVGAKRDGSPLVYISVNRQDVNAELVREGHTRARLSATRNLMLRHHQRHAQEADRGMWSSE